MSEDVRIKGPVEITSDSPQRVALDLADRIHMNEESSFKRDREYFLKLYSQCLSVVRGGSHERALEK